MTILDFVGNTPLLELKKISQDTPGVSLFAKAEFLNPSGSVKDRAARAMILAGLEQGALVPGKTIIDATSGNTGIAYSMIGAALGYPVTIYLPANASAERKRIMKCYNAEIVETSPLESSDGAFLAVKEAVAKDPERYFFPNQYNNDANWRAHYNTTGVEIWEQTGGRVTHFITGLGTSGTFMGTSRRLKDYSKDVHIYAVQPDSPFHGIEGTKHMGSTIKPGIYDETLAEAFVEVNTEASYAMARRLAREEGVFVGISAGANVVGAIQLARTLPKGSVVVTILGDSGSRYLSDSFWVEGV
ncbi:cysteine synthase family protein [Treponema primitia]|uniref:PLP-dependent cysteine synthase family protein n=1 Tax=Treponema primitia TaxID=88058 RepID=UPI00398040D2